jgi:hypothetical protein
MPSYIICQEAYCWSRSYIWIGIQLSQILLLQNYEPLPISATIRVSQSDKSKFQMENRYSSSTWPGIRHRLHVIHWPVKSFRKNLPKCMIRDIYMYTISNAVLMASTKRRAKTYMAEFQWYSRHHITTYEDFYEDMVTARNHGLSNTDLRNHPHSPFVGRIIDIDLGDHDTI